MQYHVIIGFSVPAEKVQNKENRAFLNFTIFRIFNVLILAKLTTLRIDLKRELCEF